MKILIGIISIVIIISICSCNAGKSLPLSSSNSSARSDLRPVTGDSAKLWLRHVIPLPKTVRIDSRLTLPATDIKLIIRKNATDIEKLAFDELENIIADGTGVIQSNGNFRILIGICDNEGRIDGIRVPGAKKLNDLKNNDQAYIISSVSDGISVAGLTGKGVYYGVKTLQQMIRPGLSYNKAVIPIMEVVDWPDMSERGQWGSWESNPTIMMEYVHFMAERKMNLMEVHQWGSLGFDENGKGFVKLNLLSRKKAELHAVHTVYITEHINKLTRTGIFTRYPSAKGIGEKSTSKEGSNLVVPCASDPSFIKVLSEWFESCAAQGVPDVNVWLTELGGMRCDCEKCKGQNQYVLETKACVEAWKAAHSRYPDLKVRILTSQATYKFNDLILAAITEPDIRVTFYSGDIPGTYYPVREPIISPLLEAAAKERGWFGCYPILSPSWRDILPFSSAQFIRFRMKEFIEKGITSYSGYVAHNQNNRFVDFNVTASAEWSWNLNGRTEREFAAAWATQHKISDPEKFADWAEMMGPVSWNVYGSHVPHPYFYREASEMVIKRVNPEFGKGIFKYFPDMQHLDEDIATCEKALSIAQMIRDRAAISETLTVQGYLKMIKAIFAIAETVTGNKELNDDQSAFLRARLTDLSNGEKQSTESLSAWINSVVPGFMMNNSYSSVPATQKTVADIAASVDTLGIIK